MSFDSATAAIEPVPGLPPPASDAAAFARSGALGRAGALLVVAISAIIVLPCFWHRRIEAGDLGSHVYNAWLVQLIERGETTGLWIASQWNNVLFDFLLSDLAKIFGLDIAARIAAAIAVLVFFWGAFAFVYALTRHAPWYLSPLLLAFAYGWTFNRGFLNYYLSMGLSFFALAVFSMTKGWMRLIVLAFVPPIFLAHPLGLAWLVAASVYIAIAENLPQRFHPLVVVGTIGALAMTHFYLWRHFRVESPAHSALFFSGLDQLLFTNRYAIPILLICAVFAVAFGRQALRPSGLGNWLSAGAIPLGLYVLVEAGIQLLPTTIYLPLYPAPVGDLTERLTLISAVLWCCLLGSIEPRKWHLSALSAAALVFFAFLYQDTGRLDQMEQRVEALIHTIPPGQRVLLTVVQPLNYRFSSRHILDLACPGYCFAYGNYEPPTGQFRVRTSAENAIVEGDLHSASAMEAGTYVVRQQDLPLFQIYQCGPAWMGLCMRPLRAGETNGSARHLD